jgi:hypothetical protein
MSDHYPLLVVCQDAVEAKHPSPYRMNTSIFRDIQKKQTMSTLVKKGVLSLEHKGLDVDKQMDVCLGQVTKQTRSWGKAEALKKAQLEKAVRGAFAAAQ